ncbi:unnamed protein product, partial [Mesorhabditis belari]|uniref:Secreted protein n=1 Tax=Mesorhabditis belari TaxID=2138241 RepID=A0AAF3EWL3_9BILA
MSCLTVKFLVASLLLIWCCEARTLVGWHGCTTSGGRWACAGQSCHCIRQPIYRWPTIPDDRESFIAWLSEFSERK